MAKSKLTLKDVCDAVTEKCEQAFKLCQKQAAALKTAQDEYAKLIKKKAGKMDPPTITVTNCSSSKGGVVPTEWTNLWNSSGKFYKG